MANQDVLCLTFARSFGRIDMRSLCFIILIVFSTTADSAKPRRNENARTPPFAGKWISNARLGGLGGLVIQVKDGKWQATRLVSGPDDGLVPIATVTLRPIRDETTQGRVCGFAVFRIVKSVTYTVVWLEKSKLIAEEVIVDPTDPTADRRVRFILRRQSAPRAR